MLDLGAAGKFAEIYWDQKKEGNSTPSRARKEKLEEKRLRRKGGGDISRTQSFYWVHKNNPAARKGGQGRGKEKGNEKSATVGQTLGAFLPVPQNAGENGQKRSISGNMQVCDGRRNSWGYKWEYTDIQPNSLKGAPKTKGKKRKKGTVLKKKAPTPRGKTSRTDPRLTPPLKENTRTNRGKSKNISKNERFTEIQKLDLSLSQAERQ